MRRRLSLVLACVMALGGFSAAIPGVASASCHLGGYTETQRSNTFSTAYPGNTTTSTTRVRWRYVYDCSYDIIAVEVDWRRVTLTIKGPDTYLCCYQRDLVSLHLLARYINPDTAYPSYAPCARESCTFGPWTDYGNVYIPYTPSAWSATNSPHTRMQCERCTPAGYDDLAQDYWFVHNRSDLEVVT